MAAWILRRRSLNAHSPPTQLLWPQVLNIVLPAAATSPLCVIEHTDKHRCVLLLSNCFYCLVQIVFTSWLLLLFSNSVFIDWVGQSFMIQHTMSNIVAQEHPVPLYRCLSWYNTDLTGGFFDDSRHLLYLTLPFWKATFRNIHVAQREIHFTASSGWCCY